MNKLDKAYTDLLQDILDNGVKKQDRTGTGTISVFGRQIRHDMKDGFPLLTTKKMPFKTIVTELLWFLRGDTNIKYLVDNGCNIWTGDAYKNFLNQREGKLSRPPSQEEFINKIKTDDEFANKWGELGPIYGKQWRNWSKFEEHKDAFEVDILEENEDSVSFTMDTSGMIFEIDQIQNLINDLKTNPDSRRLMVNAWNVGELDQMVLPPCHYGFQVYTRELSEKERLQILLPNVTEQADGLMAFGLELLMKKADEKNIPTRAISLMWNQRSVDTFLGLPFNIASYGLLLEIIAKEVNMVPDQLIGNLGDVHLYSNHLDAAKEQIGRRFTHEERVELLKQAMGEENYNKAVDELMPFGGGLSEYFGKYNISPGLHTRKPFPLPTLKFNPCPITGIDMEYQSIAQFEIENYQSHPAIKAPLSN
jgi:thymidylate synthase